MDLQQINKTDISSLPPEIILQIFEFLSVRERRQVSRTCKQWHQIAFNPRKIRIRIDRHNYLEVIRNIRAYEKYRNASVILLSNDKEFQNAVADFLTTVPLESLKIYSERECMQTILNDLLPRMSALTTLRIYVASPRRLPEAVVTINSPTLKSISILNHGGNERFEINCPNLTDLLIKLDDEDVDVNVVSQLQHQLQSLELDSFTNQHLQTLANANLSNLKKLVLTFGNDDEPSISVLLSKMMNLEELQLYNGIYEDITSIGEELGVLKSLSKLTLSDIVIETEGFAAALRKMVELKDLELMNCNFTPFPESCRISSEHVENLNISFESEDFSMVLPDFPRLKKLSLTTTTTSFAEIIDDTFVQICDSYPKLEELFFEVTSELYGRFYSSKSFSNIRKLKCLKNLHLVELDLDGIDWTECGEVKLANLWLQRCTIRGSEAHRMAESIGRGLQRFYLDSCELRQPRIDVVGIKEKCLQDLRNSLPRCNVSLRDCEVIAEACKFESRYKF